MSHLFSRCTLSLAVLSALPLIALTGCGATSSFSNPSIAPQIHGKIYGGQQPVVNSTVSVWEVGTTGYGSFASATPLATTTTAADGSFLITTPYLCTPGEQVYITAAGGQAVTGITNPNIMLATGLGSCTTAQSATVEINEVSTVVTAFALAQFFTPTLGAASPDSFGTDAGDLTAFTISNQSTIPTLIDLPSGTVMPNTALINIEAAKIYSLANTLAACVNDTTDGFASCNGLFTDTTNKTRGSTVPTDTLQAAVQVARFPYRNVSGLYKLAAAKSPFAGLSTTPNDWTIGVSYTSSSFALPITGTATSASSASIDIDSAGRVWFPSGLSGSTGVGYFDPTSTTFNGPYIGGILTQPQYVSIDTNGFIWVTDVASNILAYANTAAPAVSVGGKPLGPIVVSGGPVSADGNGDVWYSYLDTSNATKFGGETALTPFALGVAFTNPPTGLEVISASDGMGGVSIDALASTSGAATSCDAEGGNVTGFMVLTSTASPCTSGGGALAFQAEELITSATSLNKLCYVPTQTSNATCTASTGVNLPEGIATDGDGNEWVANSGNASVFTFGGFSTNFAATSDKPYLHDADDGNTMTAPYAIAIDGSGNVWTANASCVTTSATACTPGSFVLSELIGAAAPTITPLSSQLGNDGALIGSRPTTIPSLASSHPHPFVSSSGSNTFRDFKTTTTPFPGTR
jgi:hypothetical protein